MSRQTVQFFEIHAKRCSLTYGVSPCGGALGVTGEYKCFNTEGTCQDLASFTETTQVIRFAMKQQGLLQYGNVLPLLKQPVSITAGEVNLGGMDSGGARAFGQREVVTAVIEDEKHSDHLMDNYRLERISGEALADSNGAYDPYERGTLWSKFLSRHPYHSMYDCAVRDGYMGDALEDMRVRWYNLERIDGPDDGEVKVVGKDRFSRFERRKAVLPRPSLGVLAAGIDNNDLSATLSPTGIGDEDYPASGRVCIGDEVIPFTRSGDTLTFSARGDEGTTAEAHDQQDSVQLVYSEEAQFAHDIAYRALLYGGLDASLINKTTWDSRAEDMERLYTLHIVRPTPIEEVVGDLQRVAGFTLQPDPETDEIRFTALRSGAVSPVVNDRDWIIEGSFRHKRLHERRVSEVLVHYGLRSPTHDLKNRNSYHSTYVATNLTKEGNYGYAVEEIFAYSIPQFGRDSAEETAERILAINLDPPREVEFDIYISRNGQLQVAQYFELNAAELQDATGAVEDVTIATTMLERRHNSIGVKGIEIASFGDDSDDGVRRIRIENDAANINLRELHDAQYPAPTGDELIEFIVEETVTVSSTSATVPSIISGDWPTMVVRPKLIIYGDVRARGGNGAAAKNSNNLSSAGQAGNDGQDGGTAFEATAEFELDGTGTLWGGGGGGAGGGGAIFDHEGSLSDPRAGGGAGGGGAGTNGGNGGGQATWGGADSYTTDTANGTTATAGTATNNGSRGTGAEVKILSSGDAGKILFGGRGGHGGDPGQAGESAVAGSRSAATVRPSYLGAAGSPGAAGKAIEGIAFVEFSTSAALDIRGQQV